MSYEVIVVDDHSTDGCCDFIRDSEDIKLITAEGVGAAMARNMGAGHAEGDIFVFCDGHVFFEDFWLDRLMDPLNNGTADAVNPGIADVYDRSHIGYGYRWNGALEAKWNLGGAQRKPIPLLAGGCLAVTRRAFDQVGGFDRGFRTWGREDEEFSLKLWLFGYKCYAVPEVRIFHVFRHTPPFELSWEDVGYNFLRMAHLHFKEERVEKCRRLVKNIDADQVEKELLTGDVVQVRKSYERGRVHDDDWFMSTFHIPF